METQRGYRSLGYSLPTPVTVSYVSGGNHRARSCCATQHQCQVCDGTCLQPSSCPRSNHQVSLQGQTSGHLLSMLMRMWSHLQSSRPAKKVSISLCARIWSEKPCPHAAWCRAPPLPFAAHEPDESQHGTPVNIEVTRTVSPRHYPVS